MIAGGHVDVCYWQGDHRSDHKGKLRGRFVGVVVNACLVLWNFLVVQLKLDRFLHFNEPLKGFFDIL